MKVKHCIANLALVLVCTLALSNAASAKTRWEELRPTLENVLKGLVPKLTSLGLYPTKPQEPWDYDLRGSFYYGHSKRYMRVTRPVKEFQILNQEERKGRWVSAAPRLKPVHRSDSFGGQAESSPLPPERFQCSDFSHLRCLPLPALQTRFPQKGRKEGRKEG